MNVQPRDKPNRNRDTRPWNYKVHARIQSLSSVDLITGTILVAMSFRSEQECMCP